MSYRVVCHRSRLDLQEAINTLIADGWTLQGGVCVSEGAYYQAMVKEEKK